MYKNSTRKFPDLQSPSSDILLTDITDDNYKFGSPRPVLIIIVPKLIPHVQGV